VGMGSAVGLNHVSVVAHDLAESTRFYVEVLGLEEIPTPNFGYPVQWLAVGGQQLHLFERPEEPPASAHLAFEVDDFVAVYDRARKLGVLDRTTMGYAVAQLPGGEGQMYLRDPSGNLVELDATGASDLPEDLRDRITVLGEKFPQDGEHERARLYIGADRPLDDAPAEGAEV
jgi:catechol 2,3-dioxygenase-like lactoylglutathione lyase family enzyme